MLRPLAWAKRGLLSLACLLLVASITGAAYQWTKTGNDLASTPPPGRLVDVGGYKLHVWCTGEATPTLPTVLFDSGLGGDSFDWNDIAPSVAQLTQACTYDRAGMGYSDPGPMPRTSARIAEEMVLLIRNGGLKTPVVLVGLSFGGYNTRIVASEHPDLVAGLVLVSASHEHQGERYEAAGIPSGRPPEILLTLGPIAGRLGLLRLAGITLAASPSQAAPAVRGFVEATAFRTSRYYAMASELQETRQSGREVAAARRGLAIPLVVVSAGKGRGRAAEINAELQAAMMTLSARACQVIAEDSGHGIGEQPELVVKAIRDVVAATTEEAGKPGC